MARLCRLAALSTVLAVTLGACIFNPGDTCNDDVCIANQPPVAVIKDVGNDGALRVGSFTQVLVSAADSYDPEGTEITFAWSVSAACAGNIVGDVTSVDLTLDNLSFGTTCSVTLTVTDARNANGTATANLVVRNVGGFVTSTSNCVQIFNPDSDQPQGTPLAPFCKLDQAVMAARTYHLAQVSLDLGTHTNLGGVLVDFPVTIRGHFTSGGATWPQANSGTTTLVLQQNLAVPDDAALGVVGGVLVSLADLNIRRGGTCKADCVLIGVADASMTFTNVVAGDPSVTSNNPAANDAGGHTYVTLFATTAVQGLRAAGAPAGGGVGGATGGTATPVSTVPSVAIGHIDSAGLSIYGSRSAPVSMGIVLNAAYDADLRGLEIHERAPVAVAVRSLAARDIKLSSGIIDVQSPGGTGTAAEGIVDGERNSVSVSNCAAPALVCGSSRTLQAIGMTVTAAGGFQVVGIAGLGSQTINIDGGSVAVAGQQAWGVFTSASKDARINNVTVDATTSRPDATHKAFAVAYSDNIANDDGTIPDLGSSKITLTGSRVKAHVGGLSIDVAAAANLVGSSNAVISGNTLQVDGESYATASVTSAAALRLEATTGVAVSGGTARVMNVTVESGAAGIADGEPFRDGVTPVAASKDLTIGNVAVTTQVSFSSLGALGAGILLAKTDGVTVQSTRGLVAIDGGFSGAAVAYGVFLAGTTDAVVRDLGIAMHGAAGATFTPGTLLVGIHDGALDGPDADLSHASDNLVITGNRIHLTQATAVQIGVRIRGQAPSGKPLVDSNVIIGTVATKNIGVLLHGAHGTVAYNTVRAEGCPSCSPSLHPFGVGVYLMHCEPLDGSYLGNVFSTVAAMDTLDRPAFVEHNALTSATTANIGTVTATIYGSEVDSNAAGFVAATANDATDILSPDLMAVYLLAQVPGTGNAVASPLYCADGIHGAINGPQKGAGTAVGQVFNVDIDGETRNPASTDAGADVIATSCPP